MATNRVPSRLALLDTARVSVPAGAWWPDSRSLSAELGSLFQHWPDEAGRIVRVLYSPPDWDDRPRSVVLGAGRWVKTGCFPADDTHRLVLSMADGTRRVLTVIAPDTAPETAARVLDGFTPVASDRT